MNDDLLDAQLRTLRDHTQRLETPDAVEDFLLAAQARQQPRPRAAQAWYKRFSLPQWNAGLGLAGIAVAAFAVMVVLATPRPVPATRTASVEDSGNFIALDSAEHIALEPAPRLVETDIARTALASLGVPLSPDNAGDLVRAQFLVGADGHPLALRLLPVISSTQ